MIHAKKRYSILLKLPTVPSCTITLSIGRDDKNITGFSEGKPISIANKVSKSIPTERRFEDIVVKFSEHAVVTHVGVSRDGAELDFIGREHPLIPKQQYIKPTNVELVAYYKKQNKIKVLYRCQLSHAYAPGNIHWAMSAWSYFFAIDTNTRIVDGVSVSITSVIRGVIKGVENGKGIYKFDTYYTDVNVNVNGNPETYAICKLISQLLKKNTLASGTRIGIITDSELELIDSYNAKTRCLLPDIFPGLYLPANFHIMYASAERARDTFIPNKMMAMCDSSAAEAFKNLKIIKHS